MIHVTRDEIFNLRKGKGDRVCGRKMLEGEGERGSGTVMWEMRYRLENWGGINIMDDTDRETVILSSCTVFARNFQNLRFPQIFKAT